MSREEGNREVIALVMDSIEAVDEMTVVEKEWIVFLGKELCCDSRS